MQIRVNAHKRSTVVVGAPGPIRLKNYHDRCEAEDASPHTMNKFTGESESTSLQAPVKEFRNKATLCRLMLESV